MFIVFDLDDTLADTTHRQHILEATFDTQTEKWNTFFDACVNDEPKYEVIELLNTLATRHRVEIWTGRSSRVLGQTEAWLNEHVDNFKHVFQLRMRVEGDYREDWEVKGEWISEIGKPDIVFDDRNKVVKWWRSQGITCCQVKESDF